MSSVIKFTKYCTHTNQTQSLAFGVIVCHKLFQWSKRFECFLRWLPTITSPLSGKKVVRSKVWAKALLKHVRSALNRGWIGWWVFCCCGGGCRCLLSACLSSLFHYMASGGSDTAVFKLIVYWQTHTDLRIECPSTACVFCFLLD